jgi:tape measure domain-containing protein
MEGGDQRMSGTVDDRVVAMKFDNKQFETASAQSMSTLDKLKKSLDFSNANKSLGGLQKTAGSFNLGNIATTIEGVSTKFLAMGTIGVTALVQITQQALATGTQLAKALTIDPVQSGFQEYSTNLQSIQTILSNTQDQGTNLKQVNAALAELNAYSDRTIYNFSEMARNIGTFTAAGVDLKTSTAAIKGIANLAALSGSSAQQASTAMYQLSQAIATGTVKLIDWNSVATAGMGGPAFQTGLVNTAIKMGKLNKKVVEFDKFGRVATIGGLKFRDSLSQGKNADWLTSGVLTKALSHLTGDLTDAQLKAEGFSKSEIKAIQATARAANDAATQVKTIQQAFDVAKETAGSGWATTWQIIFGDFATAKKDMTALSNFMNGVINANAKKRNDLLKVWAKNGGRIALIDALKNALKALTTVINPIKEAWAKVFPPSTGKDLANLTKSIRDFFGHLILGKDTAAKIGHVFQGVFTILKIGQTVIGGLIGFVKDMFSIFTAGADTAGGGFLDWAVTVANAILNLNTQLTASNAIPAFFNRLSNAVGPTIAKIRDFVRAVGELIGGSLGKIPGLLDKFRGSATAANDEGLTPMQQKLETIKGGWESITAGARSALDFFKGFAATVKSVFTGGGDFATAIQENLKKVDWPLIFKATLGTGFVAGVAIIIKGAWNFIQAFQTVVGVGKSAKDAFDSLKDTFVAYQKELKARTLLLVAGAILALAVALKVLSTISWPDLIVGIGAMKLLFMMLNQSMDGISKLGEGKGMAKVPFIAAGLLLIAGAMVIFALAIKLFSMMDIGELVKGVVTIGVVLRILEVFASDMAKHNGELLKAGAGILFISLALNILAAAIFIYSKMDVETLVKGTLAIVGIITGLGLAMRAMPKEGQMFKAAAGMLLIAIALNLMIIPIKILGDMDFDTMKNAIGGLAAIMLILAIALNAMTGTLAGAAAMLVASAALIVFALAIQTLAAVGFGSVILGILGIVIAMAAIAAAAFLLAPAAIPMAIFGAALLILGAGFFLLGGGALAFATAMAIIISIMSLGMPILADTIKQFTELIPLLAEAFRVFLVSFANAFAAAVPAMVNAVTVLIIAILAAVEKLIPAFQRVFSAFIKAGLQTLASFVGDFITAGLTFVNKLLKGIADNLPGIIKSGTKIVTTLITGMGKAASDIAIAAGDAMLAFMKAITDWLNTHADMIGQAGKDLAGAIINGFTGGMASKVGDAIGAVTGLFGKVIDGAKGILDSHSPSKVFIKIGKDVTAGFVIGVAQGKQGVIDSMKAITEAIKKAKDDGLANIKDLKSKIKALEDDKGKLTPTQKRRLAEYKAELKVAEKEQKKLDAAYKTISKERKAQEAKLIALGSQYDKITEKLDAAKEKYKDALKERADFQKSITDQYNVLPTIDAEQTLDGYFDSIRRATAANIKFKETLKKLRELGLDDTSYKKFLAEGVDAQPFLDQLLSAGGSAITELSNIDNSLSQSASDLGATAASQLYDAGVNAAKGIVDGLESQLADIVKKMKTIGKAIADEIKKELGIKSPSKVMAEVGKNTVLGLKKGLDNNANVIDISAKRLGKTAVDALKDSMAGLTDVIGQDVNLSPTIAPVLDLDAFRKDAAGMGDILTAGAISPSTSTAVATDISAKTVAQQQVLQEQALAATGTTLEFTQNINSPKAVSTAEVYRQTKNTLNVVKGALQK